MTSADGVTVLVDYAHTPAGLEEVLSAARRAACDAARTPKPGGAAAPERRVRLRRRPRPRQAPGDGRDRLDAHRSCGAHFGQPAQRGSRFRSSRRSAPGVVARPRSSSRSTAARAIRLALELAQPGDVVVVAGKGHETTQQFANGTVRFNDREVVLEELARLGRASVAPGPPKAVAVIAIFTAGGVALLVSIFGTPILLRWLTRHRIGQQIREDGPASHATKAGTPTMGGIAMILSLVAGYLLGHVGTHTLALPRAVPS